MTPDLGGAAAVEAARAHLVDALGLALAGASDERVARGDAALRGEAAFALSLAVGALGLDDFDEATRAHPGAVLVPALAAAAVASDRPVAGERFATALATGYQLFQGYGRMAGAAAMHPRGLHPTSLLGPLAAAGAVATLRGDAAEGRETAVRIAASLAAGIVEFDARETMRAVQTAWAAVSGVRAARLAEAGFPASANALDAPGGLLGRDPAIDRDGLAADPLAGALAIELVSFKPYPHFSDLHPATAALVDALRSVPPSHVAGVSVRLGEKAASRLSAEFPPTTPKAAKRSARFALASVLARAIHGDDPSSLRGAFTAARLADPEVLALAERVRLGETLRDAPPTAAVVALELDDGRLVEASALSYPGDGRDPGCRWGWEDAAARFDDVTAGLPAPARAVAARARALAEGLPAAADVRRPLAAVLGLVAGPGRRHRITDPEQ